jgi:5-methylcytosine-specific restriction endonuclease McrA
MSKNTDYECPRCGYTTHHRGHMRNHLYSKNKICPAVKAVIDLSNSIKDYILDNKIYPVATNLRVEQIMQTTPKLRTSKKPISKALKIACWNKYIGEEVGKAKCVCCNLHFITQHHFHCGHVIAEAQGGKVLLENLRPICAICNHSMGTMDMQQFAKTQFDVDIQ